MSSAYFPIKRVLGYADSLLPGTNGRCNVISSPTGVSPNEKSGMFRVLNNASIGRCVPWTTRPMDDASHGRRVPWTTGPLDDESLCAARPFETDRQTDLIC